MDLADLGFGKGPLGAESEEYAEMSPLDGRVRWVKTLVVGRLVMDQPVHAAKRAVEGAKTQENKVKSHTPPSAPRHTP